jgi:hypothetical protein
MIVALLSDDEYAALQADLAVNPEQGDLIRGVSANCDGPPKVAAKAVAYGSSTIGSGRTAEP